MFTWLKNLMQKWARPKTGFVPMASTRQGKPTWSKDMALLREIQKQERVKRQPK